MREDVEHVANRPGTAVVEIGGRPPDLNEARRVKRPRIDRCARANIMQLLISQVRPAVTPDASGVEGGLPAQCRRAQCAVLQVRARYGLLRLEIGVEVEVLVMLPLDHVAEHDAGTDRGLRIGTGPRPGGWRREVGIQQTLYILGIAETVIQQIPVQPIGTATGMAAAAALPLLGRQRGIMKELLAEPDVCAPYSCPAVSSATASESLK